MKNFTNISLMIFMFLGFACARQTLQTPLPLSENTWQSPQETLVWVGRGTSYQYQESNWKRTPAQDYDFTVIQRRYVDKWDSVKIMHRRHPDYQGNAGPRDQILHFTLEYQKTASEQRTFSLETTLGNGSGQITTNYTKAMMQFQPKQISRFAPFNTYTIQQNYLYQQGELQETVLLSKRQEDSDTPFMKIEEQAKLFSQVDIQKK